MCHEPGIAADEVGESRCEAAEPDPPRGAGVRRGIGPGAQLLDIDVAVQLHIAHGRIGALVANRHVDLVAAQFEAGLVEAETVREIEAAADAQAHRLDAVLVPVQLGQVLAEGLGQAVEAVGPGRMQRRDDLVLAVEAGDVVGAGEDDALDAVLARRFVQVVGADDVAGEEAADRGRSDETEFRVPANVMASVSRGRVV